MSAIEYVLRPDANTFVIVATNSIGSSGPRGEKGSSGVPGLSLSDPYVTPDNHVTVDWSSNFGIDADGNGYYDPIPANIPADEMAWPDVTTQTLNRGLPGKPFDPPLGFLFQGAYRANYAYNTNDIVTYLGSVYRVKAAFISGAIFDATKFDVWSVGGTGTELTGFDICVDGAGNVVIKKPFFFGYNLAGEPIYSPDGAIPTNQAGELNIGTLTLSPLAA